MVNKQYNQKEKQNVKQQNLNKKQTTSMTTAYSKRNQKIRNNLNSSFFFFYNLHKLKKFKIKGLLFTSSRTENCLLSLNLNRYGT